MNFHCKSLAALTMLLATCAIQLGACHRKDNTEESVVRNSETPEKVSEETKQRIHRASLNKKGTIANDFRYVDRDGNQGSLHGLKCKRLLLIFYNPECPHCAPLIRKKAANRRLNAAIEKGEVTVLAVYAEGNRDVWEKTKDDMPKNWIVAYDLSDILDNELYDLPAMPTAYFLNSDKRVYVKDAPW